MKKPRKTFNKTTMFFLTAQQHEFLRMYADAKKVNVSKVLRACINKLMAANPEIARAAEAIEKE